jgi:hypothetical protein
MEKKIYLGVAISGLTLAYFNRNEPEISEKEKQETGNQLSLKSLGLTIAAIGGLAFILTNIFDKK